MCANQQQRQLGKDVGTPRASSHRWVGRGRGRAESALRPSAGPTVASRGRPTRDPRALHCTARPLGVRRRSGRGPFSYLSLRAMGGLIGQSWPMLFASGGFKVKLYDIEQEQITNALENIRKELKRLEQADSLKGSVSAEQQLSLISGCSNITEAVEGAMHIQIPWQ
ncbi:uncharacterized protein LOC124974061 isoform X2 [Sciurus carolinensis]|uniref:uncharacterized protein LOC124974061 isoform X2 n=1 Tax=Sciurus carolinensis TaxID=30640 RepID=UPI001FB3E3F5|nr:uncharacterized protein LOC124974061 isoform X2 [Sciurus carolinensis]